MAVIDFGGVKETVVMRKEFPMSKAKRVLKNETIEFDDRRAAEEVLWNLYR